MIQEALAIKGEQRDSTFRIMASAWTAPAVDERYRGLVPGNDNSRAASV